jgi:hypothetical protein
MMRDIRMSVGAHVLTGTLEDARAPATCAAFVKLLPLRAKLLQARWSGEAAWVPLGDLDLGVGRENAIHSPLPGQVLFYSASNVSEAEILVPYGVTAFAAKSGPLAGNHFLTIDDGQKQLAAIGTLVWWHGAADVVFEML